MSSQQPNPCNTFTPARADLGPPRAGAQEGATGRAGASIGPCSPPSANRGAEMTVPHQNRSLIDWCAVTFKVNDPFDAVRIIGLTPELFSPLPSGFSGYRKSLRCGNIAIFYEGRQDMGCHVEMTGQGCRQYEGLQALTWLDLFQKILAINGSITRLDLAIDTVDASLPLRMLYAAIRPGDIRTRFAEWRRIKKGAFRPEDNIAGETLYLGSVRSDTFFRVYNKAQEAGIEGDWIRFELQLRKERAQQAALLLGSGMEAGALATGIINQYFAVIERDDSNSSRCSLQPWWDRWLLSTEKISLGSDPAVKTISDTMDFIKKQYAPSLAMIRQHLGSQTFNGYLQDVLSDGNERMTAKHERLLRDASHRKSCKKVVLPPETGGNA